MRSARILLVAAIAGLAIACSSEGGATAPSETGTVVSQSGLNVTAKIASATLGDEGCGGQSAAPSADAAGQGKCAPTASGFAPSESGGCGSCRATSLQLAIESDKGTGSAKVLVSQVKLLDEAGAEVAKLTPSNPQLWSTGSNTYASWDQTVSAEAKLNVKYTLSAPPWSSVPSSYSKKYRLVIDLTVDGRAMSLQSELLSREAMVAT